jgi:hypothetical protein
MLLFDLPWLVEGVFKKDLLSFSSPSPCSSGDPEPDEDAEKEEEEM